MRLPIGFLLASALALSPLAVAAQTPPPAAAAAAPVPAERDQLAARLLHEIYAARGSSIAAPTIAALGDAVSFDAKDKDLPGWGDMGVAARDEVIAAQAGRLEIVYGRALLQGFTDAELRAGLVLLNDPAGRAWVAAGPNGAAAKPLFASASALMQQTPDGAGFLAKFRRWSDKSSPALDRQVFALLFPDILLSFADKIEASGGAAKPATEAQKLGKRVAIYLFNMIGPQKALEAELAKTDFSDPKFPPSWPPLARQAMRETLTLDSLYGVFGDFLATLLTEDELRAGVAFFDSVPAETMQQIMAYGSGKGPAPKMTPEIQAAVTKLMTSSAGASFIEKFGHLDSAGVDEFGASYARKVMPDFFRRFAHKVQADAAAAPKP